MNALFRIDFDAATAPIRPRMWHSESGYCTFFLFAADFEDAEKRAATILSTLPFVRLNNEALVHNCDSHEIHVLSEESEESQLAPLWHELEVNARRTGLAFAFGVINHAQPRASRSDLVRLVIDPEAPAETA